MFKLISLIILILISIPSCAKWNDWTDASSVRESLLRAQNQGKSYFSQFHEYNVRGDDIHSSVYKEKTDETPYIYGLDFYYASGTYFPEEYKKRNRRNIIDVVKKQWRENKAIPSFSWHLENPYVTNDFGDYMGCHYRYGDNEFSYPVEHRYVIHEILSGEGSASCGYGTYKMGQKDIKFDNPAEWFDDRCHEIAEIINEFVDDSGNPIPFIFRLWHECEDKWMWWGSSSVSIDDYKKFFILTQALIKKYAPNSQILWAYCTDRNWKDEDDFLCRYPGDEYVDIIGYDDYQIGNPDIFSLEVTKARMVSICAKKHGKIAALFETANKIESTADNFLDDYLSPLIDSKGVGLGLVQLWTSGRFENETQYEDRRIFLKNPHLIIKK